MKECKGCAERDEHIDELSDIAHASEEDCDEKDRRIVGLGERCKAIWDYVQSVSPWSESNDMLYEDEIITGVGLLVQDVADLKKKLGLAIETIYMATDNAMADDPDTWGQISKNLDKICDND